jgi:hypothetical protein
VTQSRIYTVTDGDTDEKHLVRAASVAQAVAHVSKRFHAVVATQDQLVALVGEGVEVEDYKPAEKAANA